MGNVVNEQNVKPVRFRLKGASLHSDDENIYFHLWGKWFRKDGILGKRDDYFVLQIRNE